MAKTVTISDKTYERLVECKGHLIQRYKKPQSFDDVISELIARYQQSITLGFVPDNEQLKKRDREKFERARDSD